ncbi:hypothetical protein Bbelb_315720 [Branchiostoma belcheri]|nr:hypothetical protein Bbelb_315720 [Branchiostoma belcheri]
MPCGKVAKRITNCDERVINGSFGSPSRLPMSTDLDMFQLLHWGVRFYGRWGVSLITLSSEVSTSSSRCDHSSLRYHVVPSNTGNTSMESRTLPLSLSLTPHTLHAFTLSRSVHAFLESLRLEVRPHVDQCLSFRDVGTFSLGPGCMLALEPWNWPVNALKRVWRSGYGTVFNNSAVYNQRPLYLMTSHVILVTHVVRSSHDLKLKAFLRAAYKLQPSCYRKGCLTYSWSFLSADSSVIACLRGYCIIKSTGDDLGRL